jgi:hypothetical protein
LLLKLPPRKPRMSELAAATMPAFPSSIKAMMVLRRTGWSTTDSDSRVVKPDPVKADRAWKRAEARDMPVATRMTVATLVMTKETATTSSSDATATTTYMLPRFRADARLPGGRFLGPPAGYGPPQDERSG